MAKAEFISANRRLKAWCETALIFWHRRAADPRGGFAEQLNLDGSPDFDHIRRVRVQFRQAYVYAHAAHLGWYSQAKEASDWAWDFATGLGSAGGAYIPGRGPKGCAHLVHGNGEMKDDMRDTYAQAFAMLSGAWRYKAFKDEAALTAADQTLEFLNTHLPSSQGGWLEALPEPHETTRRQNPHMHLFEAFLGLYSATKNGKYLALANQMFELFELHFFDKKSGTLLEFFHPDWTPLGDGGPIEPGHMMEWSWLLESYSKLSGKDTSTYSVLLYENAIKYGWNEDLGLICDAVNIDGSPSRPTFRTWPQTELIKASVARAARDSSDEMYVAAAKAINALLKYYLSTPLMGGWHDQLSKNGEVISKVMPTSTFYHLFCAAAEADDLAKRLVVSD